MTGRLGSPSDKRRNLSTSLTADVHAFETWLQWPDEGAAFITEQSLVSSSKQQDGFLLDPGFDTSDAALFTSDYSIEEQKALRPVWRRVIGPLIFPAQHYCRLVQGCLCRSTWFVGALAAVATKQSVLLSLIVSDAHSSRGLYTFQFYKHGTWRQVTVDNRLPCLEQQQRLAFASSCTPQELWPSLIEKAYARLHGGYAAIATGCVSDALTDLTGGVVDTISLSAMSEGAVWLHIMQTLSQGNIAVCTAKHAPNRATTAAGAAGWDTADHLGGILANTPYSILAAKVLPSGLQLLRLHNPWAPQGCFQGAWHVGSAEWSSSQGQAALEEDPAMQEGLQDPATFWCSFWDFMQIFTTLALLQLPSENLQQVTVISGWPGTPGMDGAEQEQQQLSAGLLMQGAAAGPQGAVQPGGQSPHGRLKPSSSTASKQHERLWQQQQQQQQVAAAQADMQTHHTPQCQQVSASSLAWACRPQFKLVVASTCEVVLSLGQRDPRIHVQPSHNTHQVPVHHHEQQQQQQQTAGLDIGLRVAHARTSRPAMPAKALAAAGFSRPSTSIMSSGVCLGSRACRSRNRSRSPTRPATAPAAAAAMAADDAAANSMCRVWMPDTCPAVADTGMSSSRDVVLRFMAEGGRTYVVMPYTRSGCDTGPFVLRAWAPCAVQLEQLPSPFCLVQGGQWVGSSAGGSRAHATWASNPQFLLTCRRQTTALLRLHRPDVCNSLLPLPFEARGCINFTVCQPDTPATGPVGTPNVVAAAAAAAAAASVTAARVVGSTCAESSMDCTALLLRLQPDTPYVVVASTAEPGVEVPFELTVISGQPLELQELPRQCTIKHTGSWDNNTAGGSNLHSSWLHNPAFTLQLDRKALCKIVLLRTGSVWRRNQALGEMLGLSVLSVPHAGSAAMREQQEQHKQHRLHSHSQQQHKHSPNSLTILKQHQLHESAFVPMQACEVEWVLPGGTPLLVVPCTYAPGVAGSFTLSLSTSGTAFTCEPLLGGLAAVLAGSSTSGGRVTQQ